MNTCISFCISPTFYVRSFFSFFKSKRIHFIIPFCSYIVLRYLKFLHIHFFELKPKFFITSFFQIKFHLWSNWKYNWKTIVVFEKYNVFNFKYHIYFNLNILPHSVWIKNIFWEIHNYKLINSLNFNHVFSTIL